MKYVTIIMQIALLVLISAAGNAIVRFFGLPVPGNVLGLLLLFLLLECKVLPLAWVEAGAGFLIAEMLLFFVPSAMGVLRFQSLFENQISSLALVVMASIAAVILLSALAAEWAGRCRGEAKEE